MGRPVSRVLFRSFRIGDDHFSRPTVARRLQQLPKGRNGAGSPCLFLPCSRWGLPSERVTPSLVGSYIKKLAPPHLFTLTTDQPAEACQTVAVHFLLHFPCPKFNRYRRTCWFGTVDVIHHRALRSPDFPPPELPLATIVRPAYGNLIVLVSLPMSATTADRYWMFTQITWRSESCTCLGAEARARMACLQWTPPHLPPCTRTASR